MKRAIFLLLCFLFIIFISGCSENNDNAPSSQQETGAPNRIAVTKIEGFSCKTEKSSYPADVDSIEVLLENRTSSDYTCDSSISIVEKLENSEWVRLPLNENALNLGAAISLKQGKSAQAKFEIGTCLSDPQPGNYRVVLSVTDNEKNKEYNLAAEFTLT